MHKTKAAEKSDAAEICKKDRVSGPRLMSPAYLYV
jgi:hypothetical protein